MYKAAKLGDYDLQITGGWIPITEFCKYIPYTEKNVKHYRNTGRWLDGVITKNHQKRIWVNVWEVSLWMIKEGF